MKNEISESVVIELRDVADKSWLDNEQKQTTQKKSGNFTVAMLATVVIWLTVAAMCFAFQGCTFAVIVDAPAWSGAPMDGGQEPMGWHTDAERKQLEELEG